LSGLRFSVTWHGAVLDVSVGPKAATYRLRDARARLTLRHAGTIVELAGSWPTTLLIEPKRPLLPPPCQPVGREPTRRTALQPQLEEAA